MFYSIKGEIVDLKALETCHLISLECSSGLCFNLKISNFTAKSCSSIGQKIKLFTQLVIRENLFELFGFLTNDEKEIFKMLISVSGVGPNFAITILSTIETEKLVEFIISGNEKELCNCKGIGKKTASRIILELKNKFDKINLNFLKSTSQNLPSNDNINEAISALVVLGFEKSKILSAISSQPKESSVQQLIKNALKTLS